MQSKVQKKNIKKKQPTTKNMKEKATVQNVVVLWNSVHLSAAGEGKGALGRGAFGKGECPGVGSLDKGSLSVV